MIVAIDGVAGSGKSTICKALAKKIGYHYVKTGGFYRAIAYKMLNLNTNTTNLAEVEKVLDSTTICVQFNGDKMSILLDGKPVDKFLETQEVSLFTTGTIAKIKRIRDFVTDIQKQTAKKYDNIIMEGRDITTVVLPNADIKIYMDCDIDVRAQRRVLQYQKNGENVPFEEVKVGMLKRDYDDMHREISPLIRLPEAFYLNTAHHTIDECVEILANHILSKQK